MHVFLCSSILAVLLTYIFTKTILLTTSSFMVKNLFAFAIVYLLASAIYCNLWGNSYLFLLKHVYRRRYESRRSSKPKLH